MKFLNSNNPKYLEARKMMVQDAIDEIIKVRNFIVIVGIHVVVPIVLVV